MLITILLFLEILILVGFFVGVRVFRNYQNRKWRRYLKEHLKYFWEATPGAWQIFTPVARECLAISLGLEVITNEEGEFVHFRDPRHNTPEAVDWHGFEHLDDFHVWRALLHRKLYQRGAPIEICEEMRKLFLKDIKNPIIPKGVKADKPFPFV